MESKKSKTKETPLSEPAAMTGQLVLAVTYRGDRVFINLDRHGKVPQRTDAYMHALRNLLEQFVQQET